MFVSIENVAASGVVASRELLAEMSIECYQECRIAGAGSVEIELRGRSTVIISAARFLPAGLTIGGSRDRRWSASGDLYP